MLSSDDYSVYNGYGAAAQQKCLAHLRHHFQRLVRLVRGQQVELAQVFVDLIDEAFEAYRHWQQIAEREQWNHWASEFQERLAQAIAQWWPHAGHDAGNLLRSLEKKAAQWWYFLDHPEIPPRQQLGRALAPLSGDQTQGQWGVAFYAPF